MLEDIWLIVLMMYFEFVLYNYSPIVYQIEIKVGYVEKVNKNELEDNSMLRVLDNMVDLYYIITLDIVNKYGWEVLFLVCTHIDVQINNLNCTKSSWFVYECDLHMSNVRLVETKNFQVTQLTFCHWDYFCVWFKYKRTQ